MSEQRFKEVLGITEKGKSLGFRVLENGTQLIGHVPHVAPEAYLHKVFAPLSDEEILRLECGVLNRRVPASYREFLTLCNGLSLYSGSLSLDGFRRSNDRAGDEVWQPFAMETPNILERPKDASHGEFFVGGYRRDGSLLYLHDGQAFRCARHSVKPLNEWSGFWEMLIGEAKRLSKLFDETGRKREAQIPTTP